MKLFLLVFAEVSLSMQMDGPDANSWPYLERRWVLVDLNWSFWISEVVRVGIVAYNL